MDVLLLGLALSAGCADNSSELEPVVSNRVAQIIIVGNENTRTGGILECLDLYPGQLLPQEAELLKAEIRLLMKYHKRFDLAAGKRPRVEVLSAGEETGYCAIRVSFPERLPRRATEPRFVSCFLFLVSCL